jgi:hypothetical protein
VKRSPEVTMASVSRVATPPPFQVAIATVGWPVIAAGCLVATDVVGVAAAVDVDEVDEVDEAGVADVALMASTGAPSPLQPNKTHREPSACARPPTKQRRLDRMLRSTLRDVAFVQEHQKARAKQPRAVHHVVDNPGCHVDLAEFLRITGGFRVVPLTLCVGFA